MILAIKIKRRNKKGFKMTNKKGCPVYCKETGKKFKSIQAAARYLKCDSWTMTRKMQAFGFFEDEKGNRYEREYPMVIDKQYDAGSEPRIQKHWTSRKKKDVFPTELPCKTPVYKSTVCDIVREACAEKILKMIQ